MSAALGTGPHHPPTSNSARPSTTPSRVCNPCPASGGVQFTEQQKDQIRALVESGDTLGAQKIILGELTTEFEGSAEAQATATGKMKVAFGNLQEEIGARLLPAVEAFSDWMLEKGIPKISEFAGWVSDTLLPALGNIKAWIEENVIPPLESMWRVLTEDIIPVLQTVAGVINDTLSPLSVA